MSSPFDSCVKTQTQKNQIQILRIVLNVNITKLNSTFAGVDTPLFASFPSFLPGNKKPTNLSQSNYQEKPKNGSYGYRRRQQVGRGDALYAYNYDSSPPPAADSSSSSSSSSASSLATKAIRASSAYWDSSLSSVYEQSALHSPRGSTPSAAKDSIYDHPPKKNMNDSKQGFWGVLARKAKSIMNDDGNMARPHETPGVTTLHTSDRSKTDQYDSKYDSPGRQKKDGPALQKGLDAIASSLNYIGGTIGNALEEGITAVENRTADIIQETRKIQIRKKSGASRSPNEASNLSSLRQPPMMQTNVQPQMHADLETQLKASRDVAMAMAAKAKLLLRELKTVKADLAFAKERCAQLEEENKVLRDSRENGDNPEDDDLTRATLHVEAFTVRRQLLLLHGLCLLFMVLYSCSLFSKEYASFYYRPVFNLLINSSCTREFSLCTGEPFLREIVEYHQLTMQDVVYLDEGTEEVTEVYPIKITTAHNTQSFGTMPAVSPTPTIPQGAVPQSVSLGSMPSLELKEVPQTVNTVNPYVQMPAEDVRRH
ncbi:UNVERIFIED_CONTAM: hypothetical protein Scaly_0273900 [Sesamum calycinum]|uniref:Uncharacterized protein n=1 Tax=Sesamum calycinum TaxID=2727403 RepID=A0AAW2S9W9_9LAMI